MYRIINALLIIDSVELSSEVIRVFEGKDLNISFKIISKQYILSHILKQKMTNLVICDSKSKTIDIFKANNIINILIPGFGYGRYA